MINSLSEARAALQVLMEEVTELSALDSLDAEQEARLESLVSDEVDTARSRVDALEAREEKVESIRKASLELNTREAGSDPMSTGTTRTKADPYDMSEVRVSSPGERVAELRSRALDAVEQAPIYMTDEQRQKAALLIEGDDKGEVAEHILTYGSPAYSADWLHYMRTGDKQRPDEQRTSLSTTGANGGYMIPFHLDPTVILTNNGSVNPFRQISRVETITSNVWHGVSSAGVTAEWTAEASEWTDASPTFVQPTVTPIKADAYVTASFEVVQDSANIASEIAKMFADAKDNLEAAAFATGTGSTQPEGLITRLAVTTNSKVAATTNASFGINDIYALVNALPARHQTNCSWLAHWSIYNLVRNFGYGSVGGSAFWVDLGPGIPSQLLGKNTYQSSSMQNSTLSNATASTDYALVLGDFSKFLIVDRIGMETVYNPIVLGTNRRPTGEVAWGCFWRVGSDTTDPNAFRMLVV